MAALGTCSIAVIAVAGLGTRRLPITKATEKSMLPVGNKPIIDYIVDDCIAAGITSFILITGDGAQQLRTYFGTNELLESYLAENGKLAQLDEIQNLRRKARFVFRTQSRDLPYGTSIPLWLARDLVASQDSFLYLYGDNLYHNNDGSSAIKAFVDQVSSLTCDAAMMAVEVPMQDVSNYGIVATAQRQGNEIFQHIVEKPKPGEAPSNLINAGCFMLKPDVFSYIERSINGSPQAEKYLTDALNWYVDDGHDIAVVRSNAQFLDCGNVDGWLHANNLILGHHN